MEVLGDDGYYPRSTSLSTPSFARWLNGKELPRDVKMKVSVASLTGLRLATDRRKSLKERAFLQSKRSMSTG
jgi:hypothetical protein